MCLIWQLEYNVCSVHFPKDSLKIIIGLWFPFWLLVLGMYNGNNVIKSKANVPKIQRFHASMQKQGCLILTRQWWGARMGPSCHRLDTPMWAFSHSFEGTVWHQSTGGVNRSAHDTEPLVASSPAETCKHTPNTVSPELLKETYLYMLWTGKVYTELTCIFLGIKSRTILL